MLPNILLIGAQKAGSTAISDWLFSQGVCGGAVYRGEPAFYKKEMHFFDSEDRWAQGKEFYKRRYQHCNQPKQKRTRFRLDATPTTMLVPDRVYETYKHVKNLSSLKIIVTLREPIARELSLYNHQLSRYQQDPDPTQWYATIAHPNGTIKTFDEHVDTNTVPQLDKQTAASLAHYARHLKRWFELFDPHQILILSYHADIRKSHRAKQRIKDFLKSPSLRTRGKFQPTNTHSSKSKVKSVQCSTRHKLQAIFEPYNQELYQLLANVSRPSMEVSPFPPFVLPDCVGNDGTAAAVG